MILAVKEYSDGLLYNCQRRVSSKKQDYAFCGSEFSYENDSFNSTQNKKRDNILLAGVLGLFFVGFSVLASAYLKTNKRSSFRESGSFVMKTFESLANKKEIPTFEQCKSLDKNLNEFLHKRINYINAPRDLKNKIGIKNDENRLLLYGKPGTGKTFFGKVLAKTLGADFMEIKFSDYNSQWIGEDIEKMQSLFEGILKEATANPKKRYVVVYNEIDTAIQPIEKLVNAGKSRHHMYKIEERATLLQYMDDISEKAPNVTIIGTTNQSPKNNGLDGAILSRFKNIVELNYPNADMLYEAIKRSLECMNSGKDFIKANKDRLKSLASEMESRRCSFRDMDKVVDKSKELHLEDALKNPNINYKFDYLKTALKSIGNTDGEFNFNSKRGEYYESKSYFIKLWNKLFNRKKSE